MYASGQGVPANEAEAIRWNQALVDAGGTFAGFARSAIASLYHRRSMIYDSGFGVPMDRAAGYWWLSLGAQYDPELLNEYLTAAAQGLSAAERAAAETRIRQALQGPEAKLGDFAAPLAALAAAAKGGKDMRAEAEKGDAMAKLRFAMRLDQGEGVNRDRGESTLWFRKAAEAGSVDAMAVLGDRFRYGWGATRDKAESLRWYRKAAEAGHAESQYRMGDAYQFGVGVEPDDAESVRWFKKAAEQGHPLGMYALGEHVARGKGVKKDEAEGARWIRRAAEEGIKYAQWEIGDIYASGRGVKKDPFEAYFWLG